MSKLEAEKSVSVEHSEFKNGNAAEQQQSPIAELTNKIENPLAGLSRDQLMEDVARFLKEKDLEEHQELFERAALVAQNPLEYESVETLTEEERLALEKETTHKWHQPMPLYLTIVLTSIGACVQGWDQTGSNGANLSFPLEFGIDNSDPTNPNYDRNNWLVGLVNSAPYFSASLLSCWCCDPINNLVGRRGTIFIAAIFCFLAPIGSATTQNWYQLFICRLLLGFGVGFKGMYISPGLYDRA